MRILNLIPLLIVVVVLSGCLDTSITQDSSGNRSNIGNSRGDLSKRYPFEFKKKLSFKIEDGMQRGIYLLEAWINPTTEGEVYVKVFDKKTGLRLSESRITSRSRRVIGWSEDGKKFFPYNSEIIVYEGDWSHEYEARFELWHRSFKGHEYKLVERTRKIHGWER